MADLVVLGCGATGSAVARLARSRGESVVATVRSDDCARRLRDEGFHVIAGPTLDAETLLPHVTPATHVVVSFPPDGVTDVHLAPRLAQARALAYVSSTAVYGSTRGRIDDTTPVAVTPDARAARILAAEEAWRAAGATVLRSPAIYGPDRGAHVRIARGEFRVAGDGKTYTSRIHVEDLARLLLATRAVRGETFVVGDMAPATQDEVAEWVSRHHGVPFPPRVPPDEVHETLRGDRCVDPSRALATLRVTLAYPDFRTGMASLPK